jgi:crossover junction endodeoxyribonuclease RuvC
MRILAIDLGTKTGWALWEDGVTTSGTWVLAKAKEITELRAKDLDRCCDFRASRLRQHILSVNPNWIYFEDVQFATSLLQVQLWSSLRAMVWLSANETARVKAVDVGTLKKFATGKGNADKPHMLEAAILKGFKSIGADDNEVDAWHLLQYALKNGTNL